MQSSRVSDSTCHYLHPHRERREERGTYMYLLDDKMVTVTVTTATSTTATFSPSRNVSCSIGKGRQVIVNWTTVATEAALAAAAEDMSDAIPPLRGTRSHRMPPPHTSHAREATLEHPLHPAPSVRP